MKTTCTFIRHNSVTNNNLISFKFFSESPVSVKMRIRHYFSQLALHSAASYDLNQEEAKSSINLEQMPFDSNVSQVRQNKF